MTQKQIWQLLIIVFVIAWSVIEITPPTGRNLIEEFKNSARVKDQNFTNILTQVERL